ncbi:ScbA/BarX family gamma-butyrolactone biosynthesis protein [Streptomyces lushanensis]|uniref:ScbA/BarX family gamma-butyrolactone biosynthesis protein n=1 Tax=Streptomyces lushanensis TaxID=1434255 RepID=UPI00082D8F91|nr:ScbA/BarX family gamma-butyrolactone biosynthesis protein [Streptomyces lushanensis]
MECASGTGRPVSPQLTTTVPREYVHRAAMAEVLLTGWRRIDGTRFSVTGQWPRLHGFFSAVDGLHDPLLAAETIRQVGSLLAHAEFGTPLGHHFLLRDLSLTVEPRHLAISGVPACLDLEVFCPQIRTRGGELAGLRYEAVVRRDGQTVATGGASFVCAAPAVYRRLRGERASRSDLWRPAPPPPVAPGSVGRTDAYDVVLSPAGEEHTWRLRVDTGHPVLFDHPVDHIPGMVLLEAARQSAHSVLRGDARVLTGFTAEFPRFAELDRECLIGVRRLPEPYPGLSSVLVTGHQEGEPVFTCVVSAPPPAGPSAPGA